MISDETITSQGQNNELNLVPSTQFQNNINLGI